MPSSRRTLRRREHSGFESLRCGGRERPPYGWGQPPGKPRTPRHIDPCRGRFHIGPGTPRRRKASVRCGVMCGPSTKGSQNMVLTDLVLRTIDGVIDDALAQAKDR